MKKINPYNIIEYKNANLFIVPNKKIFLKASDAFMYYLDNYYKIEKNVLEEQLMTYFETQGEVREFIHKVEESSPLIFHEILDRPSVTYDSNKHQITTLTLFTSRQCNLSCTYCFLSDDLHSFNSSLVGWYKAIKLFLEQDISTGNIVFTGGEPFLYWKYLKETINSINSTAAELKKHISITIKTNGSLLDLDKINYIIKNSIHLQISLDGPKEIHDSYRTTKNGSGSFKKIKENIDLLISKKYYNISFLCTLNSCTINYIKEIVSFFNSFSLINKKRINMVMSNDEDLSVSDEQLLNALPVISNNLNLFSMNDIFDLFDYSFVNLNSQNICGIGLWNVSVDTDGEVYPCYRLIENNKFRMGNVKNVNKIEDLACERCFTFYEHLFSQKCTTCIFKVLCYSNCYSDKLLNEKYCDSIKNIGKSILIHLLNNNEFREIDSI